MEKVGRNDPCPCGSGKKYKQCCFTKKGGSGLRRRFTAKVLSGPKKETQPMSPHEDKLPELMERTFGEMIRETEKKEEGAE